MKALARICCALLLLGPSCVLADVESLQISYPGKLVWGRKSDFTIGDDLAGEFKKSKVLDSCNQTGNRRYRCRNRYELSGYVETSAGRKVVLQGRVLTFRDIVEPRKDWFDAVAGSRGIDEVESYKISRQVTVDGGGSGAWQYVLEETGSPGEDSEFAAHFESQDRSIEIYRMPAPRASDASGDAAVGSRYEFVEEGRLLGVYLPGDEYPLQLQQGLDAETRLLVIAAMLLGDFRWQ